MYYLIVATQDKKRGYLAFLNVDMVFGKLTVLAFLKNQKGVMFYYK